MKDLRKIISTASPFWLSILVCKKIYHVELFTRTDSVSHFSNPNDYLQDFTFLSPHTQWHVASCVISFLAPGTSTPPPHPHPHTTSAPTLQDYFPPRWRFSSFPSPGCSAPLHTHHCNLFFEGFGRSTAMSFKKGKKSEFYKNEITWKTKELDTKQDLTYQNQSSSRPPQASLLNSISFLISWATEEGDATFPSKILRFLSFQIPQAM
jgi:hypothetical protein